jgi:SAM-dependent methyltransferase
MPSRTKSKPVYLPGHNEQLRELCRWRTVENSASHILPHLQPDTQLLDVGCGVGNMALDFAKRCGQVTGVDSCAAVLSEARQQAASQGLNNTAFVVGDIYKLDFPDDSFDVVHVHQVLQYLTDPVAAVKELRRVTKPGGIVALREVEWTAQAWWPQLPEFSLWHDLWGRVGRANGGELDAGRRLHVWALQAGFAKSGITASAAAWCFNTPEETKMWSAWWASSVEDGQGMPSLWARNAMKCGATEEDLERIKRGWIEWGRQEEAWWTMMHGQVLCFK